MAEINGKQDQESIPNGEGKEGTDSPSKPKLTAAQQARIERNRQKALLLRQARLASHPYPPPGGSQGTRSTSKTQGKVIDTGAGFLLEEDDDNPESFQAKIVHPKGALLGPGVLICDECGKEFVDSYLYNTFEAYVCDECRDPEEKHKFITRTDAKNKYLLKDVDLDKREPLLKFCLRKNPHNPRWGDMKLYLETQVISRAMEVWGSEEKLAEAHEKRQENIEKTKQKKFDKKVKELRKSVRSSLYRKEITNHEHEFEAEQYDEEEDVYSKTCTSCGHTMTYEKM